MDGKVSRPTHRDKAAHEWGTDFPICEAQTGGWIGEWVTWLTITLAMGLELCIPALPSLLPC